jgi:GTP-binding protein EngB required for normal cell division
LNIACIGRFGQGKSTGVNEILQEYKAPESSKGCSQTKNLTFYQVENAPVRILDIPGFENEQTVKDAIEKFKYCRDKMNNMKEKLHIILYFLNFNEKRAFTKLEYPIFEEIIEHESSKIIYVITHSSPNIQAKIKKKVYDRINSGIQGITKDTQIENKIEKYKASENNVVFVNFHKNDLNGDELFGEKELFKKIHDFFIESDDYKNSLKMLSEEQLELQISKLKKQAEDIIYWHKVGSYFVPVIPILGDIGFIAIKKDALKKIGKVFELDPNFSEETFKINNNNIMINNNYFFLNFWISYIKRCLILIMIMISISWPK